ncbi:hypothetical protein C8R45DRAFT_553432 [Mycena sanguinolenta]|nr:hypothetical protein C8R45DRAFT_553432 [Mycena sanguinolenta]
MICRVNTVLGILIYLLTRGTTTLGLGLMIVLQPGKWRYPTSSDKLSSRDEYPRRQSAWTSREREKQSSNRHAGIQDGKNIGSEVGSALGTLLRRGLSECTKARRRGHRRSSQQTCHFTRDEPRDIERSGCFRSCERAGNVPSRPARVQ